MRRSFVVAATMLLLCAPLALLVQPALAQVATVTAEQPPTLWDQIVGAIYPAMGLVVTGLLTWGFTWLRDKWHIDVDQGMRDALHSAIMSGILLGMKRIGFSKMPDNHVLTQQELADVAATAVQYTKTSVPEAVKGLGATDATLSKLAEGKFEGILSGLIVPKVGGADPAPAAPAAPPV